VHDSSKVLFSGKVDGEKELKKRVNSINEEGGKVGAPLKGTRGREREIRSFKAFNVRSRTTKKNVRDDEIFMEIDVNSEGKSW